MSREIEEIRRKLFAGINKGQEVVFLAVVTQVDESKFTCQVRRDDLVNYFHVRLRGVINPALDGVALIPRIGSKVLVCRIGNSNELFVCQFTEIDKIILTNGELSFTLDQEKIELLRGDTSFVLDDEKTEFIKGDTTFLIEEDSITIQKGDQVNIGIDAESAVVKAGDAIISTTTGGLTLKRGSSGLKNTLQKLLTAIQTLTVTTGVGPSGPPINIDQFIQIEQDLANYLEA